MVNRISGLASGMDIDSMVKSLMNAQKIPLDKLKQKKQLLEWQRDDYRTINTLLDTFKKQVFDMKLTTSYRAKTVTSTDDTKVSAKATSGANTGSYSISKVQALASAATLTNTGAVSKTGSKIDPSKSLLSMDSSFAKGLTWTDGVVETQKITPTAAGTEFQLNVADGTTIMNTENMTVKVNGTAYKVVTGTPTNANEVQIGTDGKLTFQKEIATGASIDVTYFTDKKIETQTLKAETKTIQLAKAGINEEDFSLTLGGTVYSAQKNSDGVYELVDGTNPAIGTINLNTGTITLNEALTAEETEMSASYQQKYANFAIKTYTSKGEVSETFTFTGNDTLNSVMSRVNSASALGVTMFYDSFTDQVSMTRKETGDFNKSGEEIHLSGDFLTNVLNFGGAAEVGGVNAKFTINGLDTERSSNTFEMSGITFTLKQTFTEGNGVSTTIANDTTAIYDNIKKVVESYNTLIDTLGKKVAEERDRNYQPLTDDERDSLSDERIEKWEKIARAGNLRNDSTINSLLTNMRYSFSNIINTSVTSDYNSMAKIGIATTSDYLSGGKLEIDETKLKKALEDDQSGVEALFTQTGSTTSEKGIMTRLYDNVNVAMNSLKSKAGNSLLTNSQFTIGRSLTDVDRRISTFETRLSAMETRYYKQFSAMEQAIQKANSQSSNLSSLFSS